jgi:hypothetical protein
MIAESEPELTSVLGLIPGIIGLAVRILQLGDERSQYLAKKRQLELLKLKCEIETLRKRSRLEIPSVLTAKDVQDFSKSSLSLFNPVRVRDTYWYHVVCTLKPASVILIMALLYILTASCLVGAAVTLGDLIDKSGKPLSKDIVISSLIFLIDLLVGPLLVASSIRLFVAFRDVTSGHREAQAEPPIKPS